MPLLVEKLSRLNRSLPAAVDHRLSLARHRLRGQEERLAAMGYKSVLGRGFSITRLKKRRTVVRGVGQLNDRVRIVTELADGGFESEVVNLNQLELFE